MNASNWPISSQIETSLRSSLMHVQQLILALIILSQVVSQGHSFLKVNLQTKVLSSPLSHNMKAAVFDEHKDDMSNVIVKDIPKPSDIPSDCVLVKVKYAAINAVDPLVANGIVGNFGWQTPLPMTMGYDLSGEIDAIGTDVTKFKVGDPVFGVIWGQKNHDTEPVIGVPLRSMRWSRQTSFPRNQKDWTSKLPPPFLWLGQLAIRHLIRLELLMDPQKRFSFWEGHQLLDLWLFKSPRPRDAG